MLYPTKGVSELTRFTPEKVLEKSGLTPSGRIPDFAALRGDPSDDLPGIPGVGEKTAAKSINQFGFIRRTSSSVSTRSRARPGRTSATTWRRSSSTAVSRRW